MNKQMWTIGIVVVLSITLLFVFALNITNERNKLAKELDYDEVKDFYYIKDMPFKFHEHSEPSVVEGDFFHSNVYTSIYEYWRNGENEIKLLSLETKFRYYNDLTFEELIENRAGPYHPITVKGVGGHYGSYAEDVYAIEYVELVIDGVFYKITIQHTNQEFFSEKNL